MVKLEVTQGLKAAAKKLSENTRQARKLDWGMTAGSFYIDKEIEESCKAAVQRGVDERLLGPVTEKNKSNVKRYLDSGVKVRSTEIKGVQFGVCDDELARFWALSGEQLRCVWVKDKALAAEFRKLYEKLWDNAQEVKF